MFSDSNVDHIEFFVKMNRLVPASNPNALLPVKFKPVFYDTNLADERKDFPCDGDERDTSEDESDTSQINTDVHKFFKNPLGEPSNTALKEDKNPDDVESGSSKLGRNMRASNGGFHVNQQRSIHELMNTRVKLLQQQKEQQILVNQEVVSEKAATTLVNNLLLKGFHISAPENTAHPKPFQFIPPPFVLEDEEEGIFPVEKEKFIGAIHKELRRLQGKTPGPSN